MTRCKSIFPEPTEPKDSFCQMPIRPLYTYTEVVRLSTCVLHTLAHQHVTCISIQNLTNLESGFWSWVILKLVETDSQALFKLGSCAACIVASWSGDWNYSQQCWKDWWGSSSVLWICKSNTKHIRRGCVKSSHKSSLDLVFCPQIYSITYC
jgi:hypothetical protein